jgi:hypothetical protein
MGTLVDRFDVVVLFCATQDALGIKYQEMIARSVREAGVGLFMSGSQEGYGGFQGKPSWGGTSIGDLLPVNVVVEARTLYGQMFIDEPGHEVITSIPWEMKNPVLANPNTWQTNIVTAKAGVDQLAHVHYRGADNPLMVTWEVADETRVFALTSEIHLLSVGISPWKYHYDFPANLMIYLDYRPVPQDSEIVNLARSRVLQVYHRRSLLVDILEFSEAFGADTSRILSEIEEVDEVIKQVNRHYLDLQFEEMLEKSEPIDVMIQELETQAVELKNQALFWVYVIEWLVVTGTALICGFVLWTIMVQRRLYREVQVTRMEPDRHMRG